LDDATPEDRPTNDHLIEFRDVSKIYGTLAANKKLSLKIRKASIHAIIGENGAGKTTAMKLLFGLESPTEGAIDYRGAPRTWRDPRGAMAAGLGMVHQHFMLSPVHSALDNVILGREVKSGSVFRRFFAPIDRATLRRELQELAIQVGFNIPWDQPAGELAVGVQQQLEIIKLLHAGVDVMIFDEPTAVLSPEETEKFLKMIRQLSQLGKTVIIITHKLREVSAVADHVTVLRKGESVASLPAAGLTIQAMADLMVGRHVRLGALGRSEALPGEEILSLEHVTLAGRSGPERLSDVCLSVRCGEIIGIAGVEGSGQSELLQVIMSPAGTLAGSKPKGMVRLFGADASGFGVADVRALGVAMVPADRLREAVISEETLLENDLLGHDHEFAKGPRGLKIFVNRTVAQVRLREEIAAFDVRPADPEAILGSLSGGNQQKFVMARELSRNPRLILVAQPTRGVDVGSIEQIHTEILRRRDQGAGVLVVSSQLDELMALSDRIVVMFQGRIAATLTRGEFNEGRIGVAMGGAQARLQS
jgi:ABC-type uncharacterized transport system ATPase subunit